LNSAFQPSNLEFLPSCPSAFLPCKEQGKIVSMKLPAAATLRLASIAAIPFAAVLLLQSTVRAQPPTKSVWDGIYNQAQAERGRALYAEQCASCHGSELTGGEMAPP
jgi:mono/diheme cytochrome c family protein